MATIQIRVPDEDKKNAEAVLKSLGMDLTTAVRVYLKRITIDGGIPFAINNRLTVNGFTPEFEAKVLESDREAREGIGLSPAFDNAKDAIDYLNSKVQSEEL